MAQEDQEVGDLKEQITGDMVKELEVLVQLSLSEAEREQAGAELTEILTYARTVQELTWTNDAVSDPDPRWREDVAEESLPRELLLANAPEAADGCFCVPNTIGTGRRS